MVNKFYIYTKDKCPYCEFAKKLLMLNECDWEEVKADKDTKSFFWDKFGKEVNTVPQVYIITEYGKQHIYIGGYAELKKWLGVME